MKIRGEVHPEVWLGDVVVHGACFLLCGQVPDKVGAPFLLQAVAVCERLENGRVVSRW
jgi:hypothetical protein